MENKKVIAKSLLKGIIAKSLIPILILVSICVIFHWIILSVWFYMDYENADKTKIILMILIGGVLPVLSYGLAGLRRFLHKAYLIIHKTVVISWVKEYADQMALEIVNRDVVNTLEKKNQNVEKFNTFISAKASKLPTLVKRIIKWVIKKINILEIIKFELKRLKRNDLQEISTQIEKFTCEKLIDVSKNLLPFWVLFLVPIQIIAFIVLWIQ